MFPPHPSVYGPGMLAYRAPSLWQPHRARQAIRDAHAKKIAPLIGYFAGLSSVPLTRLMSPMGFDMCWIDWEHTSCSVETMTTIVHETMFMSEGRTIPFVRLPGHDHASIGYALDAGASLIIPQVETVEQMREICSSAKFGKSVNGTRSAPPFRFIPGITDAPWSKTQGLHQSLNEQAAIMIQIESVKGIENLDEILTECGEHIDIVWLGSLDLRVSMDLQGNMGMPGNEPEFQEALGKFFATLKKHDKPLGGFCFGFPPFGSEEILKKAGETMSLIICTADVLRLLGLAGDLALARGLFADLQKNVEAVGAETAVSEADKAAEKAEVNGNGDTV